MINAEILLEVVEEFFKNTSKTMTIEDWNDILTQTSEEQRVRESS